MPKKKKSRKKGIGILGLIVGGTTIAVGIASTGKAGGQVVVPPGGMPPTNGETDPPENGGPGGGGDPRIRQCVDTGGIWNDQFQICEFPMGPPIPPPLSSPACGLLAANNAKGSGFYHVTDFARNVQWSPTLELATSRPTSIVIWGNAFNIQLRNWLQCRVDSGEIP